MTVSTAPPTPEAGPDRLYVAIIVYACDVDAPDHHTLYQECYTVIRASSTVDAIARAEAHAHRPLPRYQNGLGQDVVWTLKRIVDVRAALEDDFGDGVVELSALHFRNYEAYEVFMASDATSPDEVPPGPDPAACAT